MKWASIVGVVLVLGAAGFFMGRSGDPEVTDRGAAGIEFVIPDDYTVLELKSTTLGGVAARLLQALSAEDSAPDIGARIAAVFSVSGDQIQWLVDESGDLIDERIHGREGTVQRVLWRGSVRKRLQWTVNSNTLADPELPGPERRNPYH